MKAPRKATVTALLVALPLVAFLGYAMYVSVARDGHLERAGVETTGVLTSTFEKRLPGSDRGPGPTHYFARVRFHVDGRVRLGTAQVTYDYFSAATPGAQVSVRYLPEAPSEVALDPLFESRKRGKLGMIVAAIIVYMAYALYASRPRRTALPAAPGPSASTNPPPQSTPLPRAVRWASNGLLLAAVVALFTVGIRLRYAVEYATYSQLGALSLPLSMVAMALPSATLGLLNRLLMSACGRR